MVSLSSSPVTRDLRALLGPLFESTGHRRGLERALLGEFFHDSCRHEIPCFRLAGPAAGHEPIRLGFFAGVHGDEPAGIEALARFAAELAAEPERATGYELFFYPVCNPTGCAAGTRENFSRKDLNREFWCDSVEPEVRILEPELRARRFHGLITLHADDTCEGLYGYSHGRTLDEALLQRALHAAEAVLPRDRREVIDGFHAHDGVICDCFHGVLSAPAGQVPRPFDLIFETPALAPHDRQVSAAVAALSTIVADYRGFIAYAQNL
jgi:hypothetical protein